MTIRCTFENPAAYGTAGDNAYLLDDGKSHTDLRKVVIVRPGHGGDATVCGPLAVNSYHEKYRFMTEKGYVVYVINGGGWISWWNTASVNAVIAAIAHIKAVYGVTKVALMGESMGGGVVTQALKTVHADVCGLIGISAATDLDWIHGTAGYVPAYAHAGVTTFGSWAAECEASTAYNTNAAGWVAATAGHRIYDEPASWRGLGVPMRYWHGDADTVIGYQQTQSFVTNVNDPLVTFEQLAGAPHVPALPSLGGPPMSEYTDFLKSLAWA